MAATGLLRWQISAAETSLWQSLAFAEDKGDVCTLFPISHLGSLPSRVLQLLDEQPPSKSTSYVLNQPLIMVFERWHSKITPYWHIGIAIAETFLYLRRLKNLAKLFYNGESLGFVSAVSPFPRRSLLISKVMDFFSN